MKFEDYYKKIGISAGHYTQLDNLYTSASSILPEEIERSFVSGESLWFFSKNYTLCVGNWIKYDTCDMYLMPLNIQWLNIRSGRYDFQKHTDSSYLSVTVKFKGEPLGQNHNMRQIDANKVNCDELKEIITKYLMPKINN